jgi:hypothetical protein
MQFKSILHDWYDRVENMLSAFDFTLTAQNEQHSRKRFRVNILGSRNMEIS